MPRIKLTVAYDGTDYCGWQVEPNGVAIEAVLNETISALTGGDIHVLGASRTDAGVHALGNVAVFDTESTIPPDRMAYAINERLPEDIVIVDSCEVPPDWHPRYQKGIRKTYEYHIWNAPVPSPLLRRYSTFISYPLNVDRMREGAAFLVGEHDFASFCNIHTDVKNTVRRIDELSIRTREDPHGREIVLRVTGSGFLYRMVRIIAGTLIRVGSGAWEPDRVREILEAKVRTQAGITAPPEGLVLVEIKYEQ